MSGPEDAASALNARLPSEGEATNADHPVMTNLPLAVAVPCAIFFATAMATLLWASIIYIKGKRFENQMRLKREEKQARYDARS